MSKFTSVLKGIGITVAEAGLSYVGLAELSAKLFKNPAPPAGIVPQKAQDIWDAIKRAEFIAATLKDATLTGEQKRSLVVPEVTKAFLAIDDFVGQKPEDEAAFMAEINKIVDGFVGAANQFKKK